MVKPTWFMQPMRPSRVARMAAVAHLTCSFYEPIVRILPSVFKKRWWSKKTNWVGEDDLLKQINVEQHLFLKKY